jgi:hypothetical protein
MSAEKRGRLIRHYFLISLVLISGGLISSGLSEIYFRYKESAADLVRLQQEITSGVAGKIEQFVQEIERTARGAAKSREITEKGLFNNQFPQPGSLTTSQLRGLGTAGHHRPVHRRGVCQ